MANNDTHDFLAHALGTGGINIEKEFGSFLDILESDLNDNPVDSVQHFGVKGMKWGQRKSSKPAIEVKGLGPDKIVRTTKNGEELTITKDPPSSIVKFLAKVNPKIGENYNKGAFLTIKTSDGKKVGDAMVEKKGDDELNLVWLGIKSSARGRGYGSAVMDASIEFGKQSGLKKLTLEVPGNAPDARHIYEKRGFKVVKEPSSAEAKLDSVWGGLTHMVYDFDEAKHADTEQFLEHFGIKGMKWGRRKGSSDSSPSLARSAAPASDDAKDVQRYKNKVASGGTNALSTNELQKLVTRQNLEKQYSQLNQPQISDGRKLANAMLPSVGKIAYASYRAFKPAPEPPPMSTDIRRTSGKQVVGDMALNFGKQVLKEHGLAIGMQIVKSLV